MHISAVSEARFQALLTLLGVEEHSCSHDNRPQGSSDWREPECPDCHDCDYYYTKRED